MVSPQGAQSQSEKPAGISLVTVCLDPPTISVPARRSSDLGPPAISVASRLAAQLLGASFTGNMPDYLPRNRDVDLLKSMQKSEGCLCVINADSDRELGRAHV